MLSRAVILTVSMLATSVYLASAERAERLPAREPLARFPLAVADWRGMPAPAFEDRIVAVLGVDDYINRIYVGGDGEPVGLYVGYYRTQREGDTIHSPLNCLPGAGWEPVERDRVALRAAQTIGSQEPLVNRFVIQKGLERQVVLYWYQSHGRVIASEYMGKAYLVIDALRLNRTDGGLVRIITPVTGSVAEAHDRALAFANATFSHLGRFLPQ
jgi:EpsI family protein